jgi:hypothetical protein
MRSHNNNSATANFILPRHNIGEHNIDPPTSNFFIWHCLTHASAQILSVCVNIKIGLLNVQQAQTSATLESHFAALHPALPQKLSTCADQDE